VIFISLFAYFFGFKALHFYLRRIKIKNIVTLTNHILFSVPYVMDYIVTISSCFFLQNMYVRFQTLNDLWKCLPADLVPVFDQLTHIEIVNLMENTRLLHSELCELLKMFTLSHGPLLLGFFLTSFINMILAIYLIVNSDVVSIFNSNTNIWDQLLPLIVNVQIVMFLMSIIVFVSLINEKVIQRFIHPTHADIIFKSTFVHILISVELR